VPVVTSDAEGRFSIPDVEPGSWICLVRHDLYLSTSWIPVEIDASGQASLSRIEMTRGAVLRGTVLTQGGAPTTREWHVSAWLDGEDSDTPHDATTNDGGWELVGLAPGHYTLLVTRAVEWWERLSDRADSERIAKARAEIDIAAGQEVALDLQLEAGEN
jgi:hypothetical protein